MHEKTLTINRSKENNKQQVAKSTSVRVHWPLYKISPKQQFFDFETDLSRRKLFTEYYQSNEKSEILFLNNP